MSKPVAASPFYVAAIYAKRVHVGWAVRRTTGTAVRIDVACFFFRTLGEAAASEAAWQLRDKLAAEARGEAV